MHRFRHITILLSLAVPAYGSGPAGNALSFDGNDDFAQVPHSTTLNLGTQATIEFWLFQRDFGLPGSGEWLLTKGATFGAATGTGTGTSLVFCVGPVSNVGLGVGILPLSEWSHVAWTIDTDDPVARVFLNGRPVGETDHMQNGQTIPSLPLCENVNPVLIGGLPPNAGSFLDGFMDEIRIWNVARTPAEIQTHFACRIAPDTPGLVGYWKFDEALGDQQVVDSSPAGNHGWLGTTTAPEGSDPTRDMSAAPIVSGGIADHYVADTMCSNSTVPGPALLNFTFDGIAPEFGCDGTLSSRLFTGTIGPNQLAKITRIQRDCTIQSFGALICRPESVLVDVDGNWPGVCGQPNLILAGGRCDDGFDRVYVLDPTNGSICQTFVDNTLGRIGQMALNSVGDLFVGSVAGDCMNVLTGGVVVPFFCASGQSLRAVAIDENDNVYVTGSVDGIMRVIAPDGTVLDPNFASGLEGAVSHAFAPAGIFHGNLFVAAGDRVMEVDLATGQSSVFLACVEAFGIAFDPSGFMYVSSPTEDRVLKVGPGLPGDMNGDASVDLVDLPGFVLALLRLPDAPLPILTADMDGDGCANGADVGLFVTAIVGG